MVSKINKEEDMRISEIEKKFSSEETLNEVLDECKEDFEKIDYLSGLMKDSITDNPIEAKKALNELTGVYMSLKIVLAEAETQKKNRELKYYTNIKMETQNSGKKFVSASTEKEASSSVANYRRIRNIIEAYVESALRGISTLQSVLKYCGEELKLSGGNNQQ